MNALFKYYLTELYNDVPLGIYEGLLSVFCLGIVIIISYKGFEKGLRMLAGLLLIEFLVLLYCSMVFFRPISEYAEYDFHPFWSYYAMFEGHVMIIPEIIMNIVVFIPVGLLLVLSLPRLKGLQTILFGIGVSVSIEVMQLFLKRGFSEVDDMMHNTLGCMIGYGICKMVRYGYDRLYKRRLAVL